MNKKDRRHNGYITPNSTVPIKELEKNNLFIDSIYDDWQDHRDGFRDWYRDFKKIKKVERKKMNFYCNKLYEKRIRMNLKQKRLVRRRILRKNRLRSFCS